MSVSNITYLATPILPLVFEIDVVSPLPAPFRLVMLHWLLEAVKLVVDGVTELTVTRDDDEDNDLLGLSWKNSIIKSHLRKFSGKREIFLQIKHVCFVRD